MMDGADPRAQKRVGTVLNEKWTLEHLIGSGGMGDVYAARHRNGARAAVKILHPDLARMPDIRERFLREGYAANRVEHRGVVQVLDDDIVKSGPDEGSAYLVMELLEGESLQERADRSPKLTEHELLEVMDAVVDVLAAAHEHGVIHRDLKPENIFLARDPDREGVRVKVLDFGLARLTEAAGVTNAGIAVGTPSFMSPEQAAGRSDDIDGRTDVFALGATVFRIVTGRRIHDADNMVQLVVLMASNPAPPLRTVAPTVSEAFANVVDRALTFERGDRPDANAMRALVRAALERVAADDAASLAVIPFSARNVRVGSSSDIPPKSEPPPRARAITGSDATSNAKEAKWFEEEQAEEGEAKPGSEPPPLESDRPHRPLDRSVARSATLPWVLVLVLLAIGAWKLAPSVQEELVRRGSVWVSAPSATAASAPTPSSPTPQESPGPDQATAAAAMPESASEVDAGVFVDVDEDAGFLAAEDAPPDAGELSAAGVEEPVHEAGAQHAVPPRPRIERPAPHPVRPPAKKPPPPRKRKR